MGPHGSGQTVDQQIDLTEVSGDGIDDLLAEFVREGVAIERSRVDPAVERRRLESPVVVPPRRGRPRSRRLALQRNTHRGGTAAETGDDPGSQSETTGAADNQGVPGACEGAVVIDQCDLSANGRPTADGMCRGADEAADPGFDDHGSEV